MYGLRFLFRTCAPQAQVVSEQNLMQRLWDHALKAGLEAVEGKWQTLDDYFDCHPIAEDGSFQWDNISFTLKKMPHILQYVAIMIATDFS